MLFQLQNKSIGALIVTGKVVDVEVNAGKIKYILLSRHQMQGKIMT
jgi:hypothetical protein